MSFPYPKTQSTATRYLYRPFDNVAKGGCHADVYLPTTSLEKGKAWPVALAIHGGSFCLFGAKQIPAHQIDHLTSRGIAVVSIEYRLGPHFSIYDSLDDSAFAYNWIKTDLNGLIGKEGKGKVDVEKMLIFGASAGAYLTLMIAQKISPPPLAVTSFYAVTDWTAFTLKTDRDAWKEGKDEEFIAYREKVHEGLGLADWSEGALDDPPPPRMAWVRAVSAGSGCLLANLLPPSQTLTPEISKALSPIHTITDPFAHPPTFLVVPTSDQLVPPSQTHSYADKLKELGIKYEVGVVQDAPHAFEWQLADRRNEVGEGEWWRDSEKAMGWLVDHV